MGATWLFVKEAPRSCALTRADTRALARVIMKSWFRQVGAEVDLGKHPQQEGVAPAGCRTPRPAGACHVRARDPRTARGTAAPRSSNNRWQPRDPSRGWLVAQTGGGTSAVQPGSMESGIWNPHAGE